MSSDTYKPVRVDSKKAIAEARKRPGFTEAWDALEEEFLRKSLPNFAKMARLPG